MSGKSTFLRGLGLNSLLAYIGAPVCARSLLLGRFQLYTSMRVVDNLNQNMSSFYAELARIKALVETLEGKETVFYLLDEILLGTNSNDRHAGSVALIKQLTSANALGLIATHDLKLGELEHDIPQLSNYCFTSEVKGDEILFDYKIHEGIGYNFNATELMKKMGLKL
jgi:DNA mismatch repair ATPase MutS